MRKLSLILVLFSALASAQDTTITERGGTLLRVGAKSPITLTGADADMFNVTIKAGLVQPGQCYFGMAALQHTTGTSSVTYKISVGGTQANFGASAATTPLGMRFWICNDPVSLTTQTVFIDVSGVSLTVFFPAINFAADVVLKIQANGANTQAITPKMFYMRPD